MTEPDAVIVGGGAMGAAAAWALARRGRRVVLFEQFAAGHDRGSSYGATRIFRVAYRDPLYVALARRALPLWRELEHETGAVLLEQNGQLDHGWPGAVEEVGANLAAAGLDHERLSAAEAARRWSGMRFEGPVVFSPDGGRCYAQATVAALHRRARDLGAELRFGERVEALTLDPSGEGVRLRVGGSELRAPVAVAAVGAWAASLLAGVVELPPLRVTEEQPAHFRPRDPDARWPSFLHHAAPAPGQPAGFAAYGLFTPGEGMKVGEHLIGRPVDPDARAGGVDPAALARLTAYVRDWFPGLDPEPLSTTSCLYTTTPDEHFVIDRRGPVVVCSPCSGHGFKFVPAVGELVADLCDAKRHDFTPLHLP
ncbi:MAG: FAD-dependent oxidoreductase [Acidimicrobiales bacterium]